MNSATPRVFYRGTTPGDPRRIREPFAAAKGLVFVARTEEAARQYGPSIEHIEAWPGCKILTEGDPEFWQLVGRRKPPNGYIGSAGRKGESMVDVVNDAMTKAKAAGYDALSFNSDADIGTVIFNNDAFNMDRDKAPRAPVNREDLPLEIDELCFEEPFQGLMLYGGWGIHFENEDVNECKRCYRANAWEGRKLVASVRMDEHLVSQNMWTFEGYGRRGIMTALLDAVERDQGVRVTPSGDRTGDAKMFWAERIRRRIQAEECAISVRPPLPTPNSPGREVGAGP